MKNITILLCLLVQILLIGCGSKNISTSYLGQLPNNSSEIIEDLSIYIRDNFPLDTSIKINAGLSEFSENLEESLRTIGYIITQENCDVLLTYKINSMKDTTSIYVITSIIYDNEEIILGRLYDIETGEKLSPLSIIQFKG